MACAFIGFSLKQDFSYLMAWLFISAIGSYIAALLFFLREIIVTVSNIRMVHS